MTRFKRSPTAGTCLKTKRRGDPALVVWGRPGRCLLLLQHTPGRCRIYFTAPLQARQAAIPLARAGIRRQIRPVQCLSLPCCQVSPPAGHCLTLWFAGGAGAERCCRNRAPLHEPEGSSRLGPGCSAGAPQAFGGNYLAVKAAHWKRGVA